MGVVAVVGDVGFTFVALVADYVDDFLFAGARQFGDGTVDGAFLHLADPFHWEIGLVGGRGGRFLVAVDELATEPAEHVIGNRGGIADIRVPGETAWLEALVGELLHQGGKRHAILQGNGSERADGVHETANRAAFLGHRDKELTGLAVLE